MQTVVKHVNDKSCGLRQKVLRQQVTIALGANTLDNVTEFVYLSNLLTTGHTCTPKIKRRIYLASQMRVLLDC